VGKETPQVWTDKKLFNLSCSEGRDQEDRGLKTAQANNSQDPNSKKPTTKKGWWSGSRCRPLVQTPVWQENNCPQPLDQEASELGHGPRTTFRTPASPNFTTIWTGGEETRLKCPDTPQ
jgi:hypothetical protein